MAPDLTIVIIGVGNDLRSDDGVGPKVARYLGDMHPPGVRMIDQVGDGSDLINAWHEADVAFVIDCMQSGDAPGTIRRFDALQETIPEEILPGLSTHAFNISTTVRLARSVNRLPRRLLVYAVEGEAFSFGDRLTPVVEAAVAVAAKRILSDIELLRSELAASEWGR